MPSFGYIDGPTFSLRDAKIARWLGDGTYGQSYDVPAVRVLRTRIITVNGRLEGDGGIVDAHAESIAAEGTLQFGGGNLEVYAAITGNTRVTSGSTPNRIERVKFAKRAFPYFGICGKANSTDGTGDEHIWIPKVKIMEGFELGYEYGQYTQPELSFLAVPDDNYQVDGTNEIQTVTITGSPTGGTFTLTFMGATTSAIAYNAASSAVQTALQALATIGSGNATVTGSAGGPYTVTFTGALAEQNVPMLTGSGAGLTGGSSPSVSIAATTEGVDYEPVIFEKIVHETGVAVQIPPL